LKCLGLFLGSWFDLLNVVQEKPRLSRNPGRSKNAWAWTLGSGKPQALFQTQAYL